MTQFDQTTEKKAEERLPASRHPLLMDGIIREREIWRDGRNSAKPSLKILARAIRDILEVESMRTDTRKSFLQEDCEEAIAKVKKLGDWPLDSREK